MRLKLAGHSHDRQVYSFLNKKSNEEDLLRKSAVPYVCDHDDRAFAVLATLFLLPTDYLLQRLLKSASDDNFTGLFCLSFDILMASTDNCDLVLAPSPTICKAIPHRRSLWLVGLLASIELEFVEDSSKATRLPLAQFPP